MTITAMARYPQARLIRLDASIVIGAWALLAISGLAIVVIAFAKPSAIALALWALYGGMSLAALHLALALTHRCPVCAKRPMIEGFDPVHPNSVTQAKMKGWAGVAWSVHRHRRFICIHCGTAFTCDP